MNTTPISQHQMSSMVTKDIRGPVFKCVLCGDQHNGYGNNALPVMEGKCCHKCNFEKVLPVRLEKGLPKGFPMGPPHCEHCMKPLLKDDDASDDEAGKCDEECPAFDTGVPGSKTSKSLKLESIRFDGYCEHLDSIPMQDPAKYSVWEVQMAGGGSHAWWYVVHYDPKDCKNLEVYIKDIKSDMKLQDGMTILFRRSEEGNDEEQVCLWRKQDDIPESTDEYHFHTLEDFLVE